MIGAACGGGLLIIIILLVVVACCCRQKRKGKRKCCCCFCPLCYCGLFQFLQRRHQEAKCVCVSAGSDSTELTVYADVTDLNVSPLLFFRTQNFCQDVKEALKISHSFCLHANLQINTSQASCSLYDTIQENPPTPSQWVRVTLQN